MRRDNLRTWRAHSEPDNYTLQSLRIDYDQEALRHMGYLDKLKINKRINWPITVDWRYTSEERTNAVPKYCHYNAECGC